MPERRTSSSRQIRTENAKLELLETGVPDAFAKCADSIGRHAPTALAAGITAGAINGFENLQSISLKVEGGLGNLSRSEIKNLVKTAYIEAATKGNSVRRMDAAQSRRSL